MVRSAGAFWRGVRDYFMCTPSWIERGVKEDRKWASSSYLIIHL